MKRRFLSLAVTLLALALLICGITVATSAENETPSVSIDRFNLTFESDTYIKYAVRFSGIDEESITRGNTGMLYWTELQDSYTVGSESSSSEIIGHTTIEGEKYYTFSYDKFAAKQMTDYVYSVAYIIIDGEYYYSAPVKYSILTYAYDKLGYTGSATESETLKNMLVDLLAYGASAQKHFGYRTDRLADSQYYQVTVEGGTLEDGFTTGLHLSTDTVTITAPEASGDMMFAGWQNSAGELIFTDCVATIENITANVTYTAKMSSDCPHLNTVTISGKPATCTEVGLTDGQKCLKCGEIVVRQTIIDALGHTEVIEEAVAPTCTNAGLTEGKHCSVCDTVIVAQELIAPKPHTIVIVPAVEATCTETGLTEGSYCSVCGTVTVKQNVIKMIEHNFSYIDGKCQRCGVNSYLIKPREDIEYLKEKCQRVEEDFDACATSIDGHLTSCNNSACLINEIIKLYSSYRYNFEDDKYTLKALETRLCELENAETLDIQKINELNEDIKQLERYSTNFQEHEAGVAHVRAELEYGNYRYCNISTVVIPFGATSVSEHQFEWYTGITSITIPSTVTSIGDYAFRGCVSLTSIVIPDSVTSIGAQAFRDCDSLTIYCEAASQPDGWNSNWNYSDCPVVWGYKG